MPSQNLPQRQRGISSHDNCEEDIHRLEKCLQETQNNVRSLFEKSEHIQGQNLVLMSELNKYKERDKQIE